MVDACVVLLGLKEELLFGVFVDGVLEAVVVERTLFDSAVGWESFVLWC